MLYPYSLYKIILLSFADLMLVLFLQRIPSLTGDAVPLPPIRGSIVNPAELATLTENLQTQRQDKLSTSASKRASAPTLETTAEEEHGGQRKYTKRRSKQGRHSSPLVHPTDEENKRLENSKSHDAEDHSIDIWKENEKKYDRNKRLCRLMAIVAVVAVILLIVFLIIIITIGALYDSK